ncbi:MAG: cupin domain-containing protein [Acidobacteriota bacterium]
MNPRRHRLSVVFLLLAAGLITLIPSAMVFSSWAQEAAGLKWQAFELSELAAQRDVSGRAYLRFLRVPSLSTGIYQLAKGEKDPQRPHDRDKICHVISGKARFKAAGESVDVAAGSILYVKAGVEHRFHDIEEDLTVLVVFAVPLAAAKE